MISINQKTSTSRAHSYVCLPLLRSSVITRQILYQILIISTLSCICQLSAQAPTIQDCLGAISVCEQVYVESVVLDGFGSYDNEINPEFSCMANDIRSIWYTFTVNKTGDFGFVLTPDDLEDDFDWSLYDLTNARCEDIRDDPSLIVSCNAAGSDLRDQYQCNGLTGATGATSYDIQGRGCSDPDVSIVNAFSQFNDLIPVKAGNTYALLVANYSESNAGYSIDFGYSTDIGILDDIAPEVRDVRLDVPVGCSPNSIFVAFSEKVECTSVGAANFSLVDTDGRSYGLSVRSTDCELGATTTKDFILTIGERLPTGDYELTVMGSPAFSISDQCGNGFVTVYTEDISVTVEPLSDVELPLDTLICDQASLTLDVSDPAAAQYLWTDLETGTEISSDPVIDISTSGSYMVQVANLCDMREEMTMITIPADRPDDVDLGPDISLCAGSTHLLDPQLSPELRYEWSDGSAGATLSVRESGEYAVLVYDACGEIGRDEIVVEIEDISLEVNIGRDTFLCTGDMIVLDASTPGAQQYEWSDGSTQPTLSVTEMGLYSVTVSHACQTVSDQIQIDESACIDCSVYLPNAISISGRAENRSFAPLSNCSYMEYRLSVYDRWGGRVFDSSDPAAVWDGRSDGQEVSTGVYTYAIRVTYLEFGELIEEEYTGTILVAR